MQKQLIVDDAQPAGTGDRRGKTLIIHAAGDHTLRPATGVLRLLSLSLQFEG